PASSESPVASENSIRGVATVGDSEHDCRMIAIAFLFMRMLSDRFKSRRLLEAEVLVPRHQHPAQGIDLDRATLALWMGRLAWWLKPLHEVLLDTVLSYPKLFADETPLPVLDPGRGKNKA